MTQSVDRATTAPRDQQGVAVARQGTSGGVSRAGARGRNPRTPLGRGIGKYLFVAPAAIYLLALLVYPIAFNVVTSFQSLTTSNLMSGDAPWVGLDNYAAALRDPLFAKAVLNSVVFTTVSVAGHLIIGLAFALYFWRPFPGSRTMRSLFLIAYAIPIVVVAQVFRWLLDGQSGLINALVEQIPGVVGPIYWLSDPGLALPAVICVNLWIGMPFTMTAVTGALATIPVELHEAASIDGASRWRDFRHITWPLIRPTVLAVAILGVIFTFKLFDLIWVMTRGGPVNSTDVLPTIAYRLVFTQFEFGKGAAILNLVFLVLLVLSISYLAALRREEAPQ